MVRKLNKRQLTYCYWRARGKTIEESMTKSGYTCRGGSARSWGSQMENNLNIITEIEKQRLNIFDSKQITIDYILEGLNDLAKSGHKEETKVRAYELLGKYLAMFKDVSRSKVDMDISDERRKEIEDIITRYNNPKQPEEVIKSKKE